MSKLMFEALLIGTAFVSAIACILLLMKPDPPEDEWRP